MFRRKPLRPSAPIVLAAALTPLALLSPASAQLSRVVPADSYFLAVEQLYRAEYRRATRGLQAEVRSAIRTVTTRWIDSICYHTALGEALYLQGRHREALEQLDLAAELLLANADWLRTVDFRQPPRIDENRARRQPQWARPARAAVYADVPRSFLVAVGQINNNLEVQRGGVVRQAQFWRLDAQELARSIGWMIRRRGVLLGPIAAHDRLQRAIADTLSRGGLGPANHFSVSWTELWWGLAAASLGDAAQATPHLDRALTIEGRYDHQLTGLAALAKGDLALAAGDPAAAEFYAEAIYAGVAYEDVGAVYEGLLGWARARAMLPATPPGTLEESVAAWAVRRGLDQVRIEAAFSAAGSLLASGQIDEAAARLGGAFRRTREAQNGPLGVAARRLEAIVQSHRGDRDAALATASQAVVDQAAVSLRNFQIALATTRFDTGELPPTAARAVFASLLSDPSPVNWLLDPLDELAALRTDHAPALDRWFAAAVSRRKADEASEIAEIARRRKWFNSQPLGGRLAALRRLLEASDKTLTADERAARNTLLETSPEYAAAADATNDARLAIRADRGPVDTPSPERRQARKRLRRAVAQQESLLFRLALSRRPTPLAFPPAVTTVAARAALEPGQAVVAFHETRGEMFGVVLTAGGEHVWRITDAKRIRGQVAATLRAVAGPSPQKTWTYDELRDEAWRKPAAELAATLFDNARLDWPATRELIIVPGGVLWHAPFDALPITLTAGETRLLADEALVRYAPTIGLALAPKPPTPAEQRTVRVGPAANDGAPDADRLTSASNTATAELKSLATRVLVEERRDVAPGEAADLRVTPRRRGDAGPSPWPRLPYRGPSDLVFADLHTAAERAIKPTRGGRPGDELFYAACELMAAGRPTTLLTRWTTDGEHAGELIEEWLVGIDHATPAEAWRRSVQLARPMPITPGREPRVEAPDNDGLATPPDGSHPFFWSGYLLLD